MPAATRISVRDLDAVAGIVAEAAAVDGEDPFDVALIERLAQLVPADYAGYYETDGTGASVLHVQNLAWRSCPGEWGALVAKYMSWWPLRDAHLSRLDTAAKFSDFVSERGKRRNPWYANVMRPRSNEHEMKVLLPSVDGNIRGFFFVRFAGQQDFDERDRAVLTVIRSHLGAIRERWARRGRPPGLTEREIEVLQLLRVGLTNKEIADRLVISTHTVRTHLEHVFEKLDVHTRTAAAARLVNNAESTNP
jgi:DNA-binding CsgD family transcriptional regulator